jgi:hypothetical protein
MVTEDDFQLVPDGYEGTFEGFNVTQMLDENKEDEIFQEFETLFQTVESGLGRNSYSEEQKMSIRKFKLLKNMIVYLQMIPIFGKFCFYGCYCFAKAPFNLKDPAGNGKPMDNADNACRKHSRCHTCASQDFGDDKCDIFRTYKFEAIEDPVTKARHITCLNEPGSCKRAVCECDAQLAYDLKEAEMSWNILHHKRWGMFNQDNCLIHNQGGRMGEVRTERYAEPTQECCGTFPFRFPYHPDDGMGNIRRCCAGKTYNPNILECCGGEVVEYGTC